MTCVCVCVRDVCDTPVQIFFMSPAAQRTMQERCRIRSKAFEYERFEEKFHMLVNATLSAKPVFPWTQERVSLVRH